MLEHGRHGTQATYLLACAIAEKALAAADAIGCDPGPTYAELARQEREAGFPPTLNA